MEAATRRRTRAGTRCETAAVTGDTAVREDVARPRVAARVLTFEIVAIVDTEDVAQPTAAKVEVAGAGAVGPSVVGAGGATEAKHRLCHSLALHHARRPDVVLRREDLRELALVGGARCGRIVAHPLAGNKEAAR